MKFKIYDHCPEDPVQIPGSALEECGIASCGTYELHILYHAVVLLPAGFTALDLIKTVDAMLALSYDLADKLAEACGTCMDCPLDCALKAYNGGPLVKVDPSALEDAGIDPGQKLYCMGDPDTKLVHVMPASHAHDLSDIPETSLGWLRASLVCMDQLNDHIMEEAIIYGE